MFNNYNGGDKHRPKPMIPHQPDSRSTDQSPAGKSNIVGEVIKDTAGYVWESIIKTSLLKLLDNIIVGAKDKIIWKGQSQNSQSAFTQYSLPSRQTTLKVVRRRYDEVPIPSRELAIDILNEMNRRIVQYGDVSVADLYIMLNEPTEWTDNNYCWYSMRGADARQVPGGCWVLSLPDPSPVMKV